MRQECATVLKFGVIERVLILEPTDYPGLEEGEGLPKLLGVVTEVKALPGGKRRVKTLYAPERKDPDKPAGG